MSKPKYQWWGYAKSMIRRYPDRVNEDERRAVESAIAETDRLRNGDVRLKVVQLVLMQQTHTIEGAAQRCFVSEATAKIYHSDFIRSVGRHFSCQSLIPPTPEETAR